MLPDAIKLERLANDLASQCTYRCVVLPDEPIQLVDLLTPESQCTYRCVVLPDFAQG